MPNKGLRRTAKRHAISPPGDGSDFKELFTWAVNAGAGRSLDSEGLPSGPWTAELLSQEFDYVSAAEHSIDLRTVQLWFQKDNDKGISAENIRWLARIFGAGDRDLTVLWQRELSAAKQRLSAKRLSTRVMPQQQSQNTAPPESGRSVWIEELRMSENDLLVWPAKFSESLVGRGNFLFVLSTFWIFYTALGILNYFFGVMDVTYTAVEGLHKQIGYIYLPTLTILPALLIPAYLYETESLISYWKSTARPKLSGIEGISNVSWEAVVLKHAIVFFIIYAICILFVFVLQWGIVYLPAYISGLAEKVSIDRYLLPVVRPDVMSIKDAFLLSILGYMFAAVEILFWFLGLLYIYLISEDYAKIMEKINTYDKREVLDAASKIQNDLRHRIIYLTILSIWIASMIKLETLYLENAAQDITSWLVDDFINAIRFDQSKIASLEKSSISHFTTFLMIAVTLIIYFVAHSRIYGTSFKQLAETRRHSTLTLGDIFDDWLIVTLLVNFLFLGQFSGFSVLLMISCSATLLYIWKYQYLHRRRFP